MNDVHPQICGAQVCIVKGGDLDLHIQAQKSSGKQFELSLILDWFVQLTNAVRYIHERCGTIFNIIIYCDVLIDGYCTET